MKTNSALNLLQHIGGTAAIIADAGWMPHFQRDKEEKKERISQPLRSYLKRYRNNIAEYIRFKRNGWKHIEA